VWSFDDGSRSVTHPLFEFLATRMEPAHATLREACDDRAIAEVETKLGRRLPRAFVALYREHDGQDEAAPPACVFESLRWLPLGECLDARTRMIEVLDELRRDFPNVEPWHADWLPFAADGAGHVWALDLASGAVFAWSHDRDDRLRLATSFDAFVVEYVTSFARGERVVDPKRGATRTRPRGLSDEARRAPIENRRRVVALSVVLAYAIVIAICAVVVDRCRAATRRSTHEARSPSGSR
jgi:cell wall assembly regulator SMI1